MITILVLFCQLALSHIHCTPLDVGSSSQSSGPDIETWSLREVFIRPEQMDQLPEHYTRRPRLFRHGNAFCIDEMREVTEESQQDRRLIACFKDKDFYSYLEDTIYIILQYPQRVIRMTLLKKKEAVDLQNYFQPVTYERMFTVMRRYGLNLIIETTGLAALRSAESADSERTTSSLTLTMLAEMDPLGSGAGKRRFVISGGQQRQLFAVFNEGDYNFVRFKVNGIGTRRFQFIVKPPGRFWGEMHYFSVVSKFEDTADRLDREMRLYASEDIPVPDRNYETPPAPSTSTGN